MRGPPADPEALSHALGRIRPDQIVFEACTSEALAPGLGSGHRARSRHRDIAIV